MALCHFEALNEVWLLGYHGTQFWARYGNLLCLIIPYFVGCKGLRSFIINDGVNNRPN